MKRLSVINKEAAKPIHPKKPFRYFGETYQDLEDFLSRVEVVGKKVLLSSTGKSYEYHLQDSENGLLQIPKAYYVKSSIEDITNDYTQKSFNKLAIELMWKKDMQQFNRQFEYARDVKEEKMNGVEKILHMSKRYQARIPSWWSPIFPTPYVDGHVLNM